MISNTLGAPLGGTTEGGQYGFESFALSLITPPNFDGGGGSCLPSIVVVALGEPGVPVICWAEAGEMASASNAASAKPKVRIMSLSSICRSYELIARRPGRSDQRCADRFCQTEEDYGSVAAEAGG